MAIRKTRTTRKPARKPMRNAAHKASRPWTTGECSFMRKYYRKFETAWCARQLGRTVYSVRYKAVDLSIKKASPSIWKGNKGPTNAFRSFGKSTTRKVTRRATTKRRTSTKPSWRASAKKKAARKPKARKTTTRRRTR